jgi:hypothetical protein
MRLHKHSATSEEHEFSESSTNETDTFAKSEFVIKKLSVFSADGAKNLRESDINALLQTFAYLKELKNIDYNMKNIHFVDKLFYLFNKRQKIEQCNYRRYLIASIVISVCYTFVYLILNSTNSLCAELFVLSIHFFTFLFWIYSLYAATMKRTRVKKHSVFDTVGNCF